MAEFRLLGPVELAVPGRILDLGPPKRRTVFAALAVDAGRPVTVDTLVDRVWDEAPPAEARSALYAHILWIRRVLVEAAETSGVPLRLDRRAGGYLLDVDLDLVDLHRFRRLVDQARDPQRSDDQQAQLLREALGLWRGTPLHGLSGSWVEQLRNGCLERHLDASVAWAEVEVRLGNHEPILPELRKLVGDHPSVEPLTAALIRALHATGRVAEALDCYATIQRRLVEDLGVDPGAELQGLHRAILRGELGLPATPAAPERTVPAHLPADVRGFAGRDAALARLDDIMAAAGEQPTSVVISAVSGTAGVGKTALAVHWAHRVADRFPDGQLYVNLRGFDAGGRVMAPAEAVRGFLDALEVSPQRIPAELDAQVTLYRSRLAGRRVLVLLDNARDAEQVRPLLPGTPTALAVVTSRNQLTSLVALDGAQPVTLDVLSTVEARELLAGRLGADRVAAEPGAVDQIITACARLPLALSIAAARARQTGFSLATLAADLSGLGERLDALDAGDAASQVRAVFSWSYSAATPPAARLFRLLGLHPGPDISTPAAASLGGDGRSTTRRLLTELVRANLIVEHVPGRYTFHDLLRAYATDLSQTHDSDGTRRAALTRMLDHYLYTTHAADRLLSPHRDPSRLPLLPGTDTHPERPVDYREAMAWLALEHRVLLAALRLAADAGFDTRTWQLAWSLDMFLGMRGHWHDQAAAWHTALPAAHRLGNPALQADAHRRIANANIRLGRHADAQTHLRHTLDLYTWAGDQAGQADTYRSMSYLSGRQGQWRKALTCSQRALTLYQAAGNRRGQADALNEVGWDHAQLGECQQAIAYCEQALTLHRRLGNRIGEAPTWDSLGYAHHRLGHYAEAADCYQHALTLRREMGARYGEAVTLTHLGDTHHAAGDPEAARTAWQQAVDILDELDPPDAAEVRTKLGQNRGVLR